MQKLCLYFYLYDIQLIVRDFRFYQQQNSNNVSIFQI